jgi:predicted RNA binding protein YcfA (HicA-like mRNA interferase family)
MMATNLSIGEGIEQMDQRNALEKWLEEFEDIADFQTFESDVPRVESEPIYLDLEMLKGGSEYDPKIEASINDWLDSFDNESVFNDNKETGPLEKLAWYNPITFHGLDAGIYITVEGLGVYGARFRRALRATSSTTDIGRISLLAAYHVLLCHEIFHHRVEWFAFKIGNSFQINGIETYRKYSRDVYYPHANPYDDDLLEEALASASMIHSLKLFGGSQLFSKAELDSISAALKAGFPSKPPGYRRAVDYISPKKYKIGMHNLGKSIHDASLYISSQPILKPDFALGTSTLDKYFISTVQIVSIGKANAISKFPVLGLSVPHRKITELLKKNGYEPTSRGKGSHTVWVAQGKPSITLPQRSDHEGYKVLQNVAKSLGLDSLRELQNQILTL